MPQGSRWEVAPVAGGTRLTSSGWVHLPAGTLSKFVRMNAAAQQAGHEAYVRRVKALLESGAVEPSDPSSGTG